MSNFIASESVTAFYPGYYLKEVLEESGLSEKEYALRLETTPQKLSMLLQGENNITEETAEKIAKLLGGTKEYWLRLQREAFDEKKALLNM